MNRDDLLKRCVDRRVAHETSVVAVSHLFYVYLLSALKKGQQVEVPNFGTFGTHMVGVKRQRRMPFFEIENDLADKVNERYRDLKTLLMGKYELVPVEGEVEYAGKEPKPDSPVDVMGTETILDTERELSVDVFRKEAEVKPVASVGKKLRPVVPPEIHEAVSSPSELSQTEESQSDEPVTPRLKERKLMPSPNYNLRDEGMDDATQPIGPVPEQSAPPPTLRDISGGEGPSALLQILFGLLILGAITFALNYFGIIHLWGKKVTTQTVEEALPPVVQPSPKTEESISQGQPPIDESLNQQAGEPTIPKDDVSEDASPAKTEKTVPVPVPQKKVATAPPAGAGNFTVQVSSWRSRGDADGVVGRLSKSGFDAYIVEGIVKGKTWFRVRVGRYASMEDAQSASTRLKGANENGVWVTKLE